KDRSVSPDAERHRNDGKRGETGLFHQLPKTEPNILQKCFHKRALLHYEMQRGRTLDSGNVVCYSISASLESLVVRTIVTVAGFFLATNGVFPQADETSRSWNKPVTPFRIAGNLYYVGAAEITSYLITTPEGHFLLDGGFATRVGRRLL